MAVGFTWTDFQPEPSILDPFRTIFDVLGPTWKSGLGQSVAWRAETWPGPPNQACRFRNFFLGPIPELLFCSFFVACPGKSSNNVDPADPTRFVAFPGNSTNNVDKNPDLAFLDFVGSAGSTLFKEFPGNATKNLQNYPSVTLTSVCFMT